MTDQGLEVRRYQPAGPTREERQKKEKEVCFEGNVISSSEDAIFPTTFFQDKVRTGKLYPDSGPRLIRILQSFANYLPLNIQSFIEKSELQCKLLTDRTVEASDREDSFTVLFSENT